MNRRSFLSLLGAAGAGVTLSGLPEELIWIPAEKALITPSETVFGLHNVMMSLCEDISIKFKNRTGRELRSIPLPDKTAPLGTTIYHTSLTSPSMRDYRTAEICCNYEMYLTPRGDVFTKKEIQTISDRFVDRITEPGDNVSLSVTHARDLPWNTGTKIFTYDYKGVSLTVLVVRDLKSEFMILNFLGARFL